MPRYVKFDRFVLDTRDQLLIDGEQSRPVQAKVHELLLLLLDQPGRLFTREELDARLWPDVHVADGSLTKAVSRLRGLLRGSRVLHTVPGRGYQLLAEVGVEAEPPGLCPLLGRRREQAVIEALANGEVAAFTGPPGIGRSAVLSLAGDGLRVELLRDSDLCGAMAGALGLEPGAPAAIGRALARRGGLVIIDDLHLDARGPELVNAWREAAPRCRWLVTSRRHLRIGERASHVLTGLCEPDGAELLSRRSGSDAPELPAISRALDGNPLALELAAARLRTMTPRELLDRLDERLALLREGTRSLARELELSWLALSDCERDVLACLATVRTPLPLAAAEATVGPKLHEALPGLAETSWLWVQAADGVSRLGMLANQRVWLDRQPHGPAQREALERATAWACERGNQHVAQVLASGELASSRWLEDHGAWLAALAGVLQGPPLAKVARIAVFALARRGELRDIPPIARRALEIGAPTCEARVDLLVQLGLALRGDERYEEAHQAHELATQAADALGDPRLRAAAWCERTMSATAAGHDAAPLASHAVELAAQVDPEAHAKALLVAFLASRQRGGVELEPLEQACRLPLEPRSQTRDFVRYALGNALHEVGRLREAEAAYREWLTEFPSAETLHRVAVQANLGLLLHQVGRFEEGLPELDAAIEATRRARNPAATALFMGWQVRARLAAGLPWGEAIEAMTALLDEHPSLTEGRALLRLVGGLQALREGDPYRAQARLASAERWLHREYQALGLAAACVASAWVGRHDDARACAERARQAVCSEVGGLAAALAEAWSLWTQGDETAFAPFTRAEAPWMAPPQHRLLEIRWLTPDLTRSRPSDLT